MQGSPAFFAILLGTILGVLGASLSKALRYKAPDECKWVTTSETENDVSLVCRLRTINSELENTNFSVIQPRHTVRLRLECSDALFFQSSLSAGSFRPLVELRELAIEYCKIGNLSDDAFRGLNQLRNLTVRTHNTDWSAMALDISVGVFGKELAHLERLDLGENNMWSIPEGALCPLLNLEVLNLTRNRLREVNSFHFGSNVRCATGLRELDLSNNSFESLANTAFSGLFRLRNFDLSSNSITFLADRALEGLTSLTILNLSNNRLASLPPELFSDTRNIQQIHLRNNTLSVLPPGLFGELTQLLILDLSWNELTAEWVNAATFFGLVRLVVIDLSYNRIARLDSAVFRDLYSLQILRLQGNLLDSLSGNTFSALYNLHTLVLSDNQLTVIDATTLSGLYVLSLLSLDNNKLKWLHSDSLKNASSLQDLHLNGNRLTSIPDALLATPMLRTLDLGENLITEIPNGAFDHMQNVYGLRLTENQIGNLTKDVFEKITTLKILNLSRNQVQYIEAGAFNANVNLQAIRLDGNQLTDITGLFDMLPNLVWLNVSDNRLKWFDYAMIPTGLQWLDIHSNDISELGNYFEIESQLQLNTFDASYNKLTEITGNAIPKSVELLYLNGNLISKVQSYAFFKKPNLTRVELKSNLIHSLDPYSLRISAVPRDRSLPEFYIGDNSYLCDCTMEWLQNVNRQSQTRTQPRVSDLDSIYCTLLYDRERMTVPLMDASHSQFLCKYETHCSAFCHCCEFNACDCRMTCPMNCTCYRDQSWSANVVDCSAGQHFETLPEQIPMDATQLYLDGNDLKIVFSHAFIGRKKLKVLYLNASNIEIVQNRSFNGLLELDELYLQNNRICELKGHEFEGLDRLQTLFLQHNKIRYIANDTFAPLSMLHTLKLDGNHLTSFVPWPLPIFINITLSRNPWSCDCEYLGAFQTWLIEFHVNDANDIRCVYNVTGLEVYSDDMFENDEFGFYFIGNTNNTCAGIATIENNAHENLTKTIIERQVLHNYLPLLVVTLTVSLLTIFVCLMVFIFRHEMRIWFHSHFGVRIFYRTNDIDRDDRDKLFDAFVSYSSKDETFVVEELAPLLEMGNPSYKVCLHYRDFPVGSFVADTIVQAVETSRRTIIVLSENFIESEWCQFEFKSAHHQILRDRRRRLILVLVGDLPQKDLDPDIRLYLKTNTYLQWGEKLFWEKLRFALPDVSNDPRRQLERRKPPPVRRQHNTRTINSQHTIAVHI